MRGATFVSKTTTLFPRPGNMPMMEDGVTPKGLLPACIKVRPLKGVVLNSVGLSGPGLFDLLDSGRWQARKNPFMISFMSLAPTPAQRVMELRGLVSVLRPRIHEFAAPFGLEINFSCPNVGLDTSSMDVEIMDALEAASPLGVPLVPNFGPDVSIDTLLEVAGHPSCDAVSIANTLKWGKMPEVVDWQGLWGSEKSPLHDLGGGGLSGKPLLPIVLRTVRHAVREGVKKPVIAGGGVLCKDDAKQLMAAGAQVVKLGTIAMLRPWNVRGVIRAIHDSEKEGVPCQA